MTGQESVTNEFDLVDLETTHLDVVASWENLYNTYDSLRLTDQLSDEERLEEFKWIIQQMNSFLTKIRTRLMTCKNARVMTDLLKDSFVPKGQVELSTRKALVYQKLRRQWIRSMIMSLQSMEAMEEGGQDGYAE